jgi:hypothetical protein
MDRLYFLRVNSLISNEVIDLSDARGVGRKQLVGNIDIALALPESKTRVGYVPGADEKVISRRNAFIPLAGMDLWKSDVYGGSHG